MRNSISGNQGMAPSGDQIIAKALGKQTDFDSLQFGVMPYFDQGNANAKTASDKKYAAYQKIVGRDVLPMGMEKNLKTIEALRYTAYKQGMTPRLMPVSELFIDPEKK